MSDRLLLDTHAFLWWINNDPRLSVTACSAITEARTVLFSVASAWEIAIKAGLGRIDVPKNLRPFLSDQIRRNGFDTLAVKLEHATWVLRLEAHHRDPFDRLLIAQASVERAVFVTCDPEIQRYGVDTVW